MTPHSPVNDSATSSPRKPSDLDALTGGVFSAPTSGERTARVRDWLATEPDADLLTEVFKELSHRDKGAAKPLREKLDELRRARQQETLATEWADKARTLLGATRFNMADAMAWQRDAAKAGAPLSREPLASLKTELAERLRAIEDLQHRVLVEREAAVLLAQRIEVLSTKPWRDAQAARDALQEDVGAWLAQSDALQADAHWGSVDVKLPGQLDASRQQLSVVWEAFGAALSQAVSADADPQAPLPAVPVWADELRAARGDAVPTPAPEADTQALQARRQQAAEALAPLIAALQQQVGEGHGKATTKTAADLRAALKQHGRHVGPELDAQAQAALAQAGELEGWQRWRADQLRTELVTKAEALMSVPAEQRLGGRKMQETLRALREQWKATDQGGEPNHALWKRFDEACNQAHKVVEEWLTQIRQQAEQHKAQRQELIAAVRAWTEAHAGDTDWKKQARELHAFAERWRGAGHLSEKQFAELQPQWKDVMHQAHVRLEAAQAQSLARRRAMIDEAQALGEAPALRMDAVRALQQRWQAEAQAVPLDRKQEQKLWESFRAPLDAAFQRKGQERERAATALSAHDQRVLDAAKALDAANASADAARIRQAVAELQAALRGQTDATAASMAEAEGGSVEGTVDGIARSDGTDSAEPAAADAAPAPAPAPARKLVAMRGDDRPGMKKAEPAVQGRREDRRPDARAGAGAGSGARRDSRGDDRRPPRGDRFERTDRPERGPRLGDAAFRAQRDALDRADAALRKLAAQAHGEVLTRVLSAWEKRDAAELPATQELGDKVNAATRAAWSQALAQPAKDGSAQALLRLEIAAEVPTPAEQLSERRMLQLQLLTRRHDAPPAQTWAQDTAAVLAGGYDAAQARRLQNALKVLMRKG